ncbi:MAG: methyl-accepting chemotaxis protein [Desulfobacteraceae bacterium]|nr:methyl-accepting chemotaxis protein [Desulfobacteraceae bacterium]
MFKNMGLKGKLLLSICTILFAALAISNYITTSKTYSASKKAAMEKTEAMAGLYAAQIQLELDQALDAGRTLAELFSGLKAQETMPERKTLIGMMKEVLTDNPEFLGVWAVMEPDALDGRDTDFTNADGHDDKGRFIPYWNRVGGIHLEPCTGAEDGTTEGFYTKPRATGKEVVMEPVTYEIGGRQMTVVSVCIPVKYQNRVIGVTGIDFSMEAMGELVLKIKPYTSGYGALISGTGAIVAHPEKSQVGKNVKEFVSQATYHSISRGEPAVEEFKSTMTGKENVFVFAPITPGRTGVAWSIAVSVPLDEIMAGARALRNINILIAVITLAILIGAVYFIAGAIIVTPVKQVVAGLYDIAEGDGDTTKRLDVLAGDEIGELAKAFNMFMEKLQDLIRTVTTDTHTLDASAASLAEIAGVMSSGAEETSEKSGTVAAATEEMTSNISSVAAAMEEASSNITMVASATEEMTSTINEIAGNSEKARSISEDAVKKAANASGSMAELGKAAQEIGKVTETINDISEQTNLLALNATIEAARAGEAGKGFAVVASEIKELARQTADATREIQEKINGVQSTAQGTVSEIQEVTTVIGDMNDIVSTIASAVEEQSIATTEISENISNASTGVSEVGENMSQVSAASDEIASEIAYVNNSAEEISNSSGQVNDKADGLSELAGKLKEILGTFKA